MIAMNMKTIFFLFFVPLFVLSGIFFTQQGFIDVAFAQEESSGYCTGANAPESFPNIEAELRSYWSARLAGLPSPNAAFARASEYDSGSCEAYRFTFDSHPGGPAQPVRLHGRYWKPQGSGTYPGLLLSNGYGGTMTQWQDAGQFCDEFKAAVMIYDYRGVGENLTDPATANQYTAFTDAFITEYIGQGNSEYWSESGVTMDAIQAVNVLKSRPGVCTEGIVIGGFSWGGFTSLVIPVLRSESFGGEADVRKALAGAPGPTAKRIANLFADWPNHPGVKALRSYIDKHPLEHKDVCRMMYFGNAYNLVDAMEGITLQGWIGEKDPGFQWAIDTFGLIDSSKNTKKVITAAGKGHDFDAWLTDSRVKDFMRDQLICKTPRSFLSEASPTESPPTGFDTTPPILSNLEPAGTLPAGSKAILARFKTNESARCGGSASSGVIDNPDVKEFMSPDGISHSYLLERLRNGKSYTLYIRCMDNAGNITPTDTILKFSIARRITEQPSFVIFVIIVVIIFLSAAVLVWKKLIPRLIKKRQLNNLDDRKSKMS